MPGMYCLNDLLKLFQAESADVLLLQPETLPEMTVGGRTRLLDLPPITADEVASLFQTFAPPERLDELRRCGDVHFNFSFENSPRFKVSASLTGEAMSLRFLRLSN